MWLTITYNAWSGNATPLYATESPKELFRGVVAPNAYCVSVLVANQSQKSLKLSYFPGFSHFATPFIYSIEETSHHSETWRCPWCGCGSWSWTWTWSWSSWWPRGPGPVPGPAQAPAGQTGGPSSSGCTSRPHQTGRQTDRVWRRQQGRYQGRRAWRTTKTTARYRMQHIQIIRINSNSLSFDNRI